MSSPDWKVNALQANDAGETSSSRTRQLSSAERTVAVLVALAGYPRSVQTAALQCMAYPALSVRIIAARCGVSESTVKRARQAISRLMCPVPVPRLGSSEHNTQAERARGDAEDHVTNGAGAPLGIDPKRVSKKRGKRK